MDKIFLVNVEKWEKKTGEEFYVVHYERDGRLIRNFITLEDYNKIASRNLFKKEVQPVYGFDAYDKRKLIDVK